MRGRLAAVWMLGCALATAAPAAQLAVGSGAAVDLGTGSLDLGLEKTYQLLDLGDGTFVLRDGDSYLFADYNAGGFLSTNPGLINDWWMFTVQGANPPADPDPAAYLAANADLAAVFGTDHAAALAHYQQYGWAEGRPTAP